MTFIVTCRSKDGSLREEPIEAASRTDCIAECKRRGIAPMGIRDGKPRAVSKKSAREPRWKRGLFFALVVFCAAVIGGVWWSLSHDGEAASPPNPPTAEKPKAERKPVQKPVPKPVKADMPEPSTNRVPFKAKTKPVATAEVEPPEIRQEKLLAFYHAINPGLVRDHELFKHDSDIMICDVITARPGERLIELELDRDFDRKFAASLAEPIPPHEKDTEDDRLVKDAVAKARQTLADRMATGESPAQIIMEARQDLNKIADYRDLLENEMRKMAETDDEQTVDAFVVEANKLLDEYGAFHIKLGKKLRTKIRDRAEAAGSPQPSAQSIQ